MPTTESIDESEEYSHVVAYVYESRNTEYGGSWDDPVVRIIHPETISNIKYRNLIRVAPVDEVDGDPDTLATRFFTNRYPDSEKPGLTLEGVSESNSSIASATQLAPIAEDRDKTIRVSAIQSNQNGVFFEHKEKDAFYYVARAKNEAEKLTIQDDGSFVISDAIIRNIWNYEVAGRIAQTQYEHTPFSEPKFLRLRDNEYVTTTRRTEMIQPASEE